MIFGRINLFALAIVGKFACKGAVFSTDIWFMPKNSQKSQKLDSVHVGIVSPDNSVFLIRLMIDLLLETSKQLLPSEVFIE